MKRLEDYTEIVGEETINQIYSRARELQGRKIVEINSTAEGGGVAEMLKSLVPLINDAGVDTEWQVLQGSPDFFDLTKEFHNALQGGALQLDAVKEQLYLDINEAFSSQWQVAADGVVVHDPQPLPLINFQSKNQPWVWRCHVDMSQPNGMLWELLKRFITSYDMSVISSKNYWKKDLPVEQRIVYPAIDPLSPKNMDLTDEQVLSYVQGAGIPMDKPVITQVSRMDKWKDPEGLVDVFEAVKRHVDCRLLYVYSTSVDDPEGEEMLARTKSKAEKYLDTGDVLFVGDNNDMLVNAVQRFSSVVMQKSIREGFCLCVTEALWKGRPVVGTNVGGIPIQLRDGENGFVVSPDDTGMFADRVVQLLQDRNLAERMGRNGRETVRREFLITRLILDRLALYASLWNKGN